MKSADQQIRSISKESLTQLAREYEELKRIASPEAPSKLIEIGNIIESSQGSFDISGEFDVDLFRIFLQSRKLSDISSDIVLSKINSEELEIESLGSNVGQSIIDQIVMTRFDSLGDKILHFNYMAKKHEAELAKSIRHLLVLAHIADRQFYLYLESLILQLDDVRYFPEQYSYNPYYGKKDLLVEAVSHLLNIVIKRHSQTEDGIVYMKSLIDKYKLVIQYKYIFEPNTKGVCHPIFYLVESNMWDELYKWIEEDPMILMVSDSIGKNPLITTILTFAHGSIKKQHDQLLELQKFAIDKYIEGNLGQFLPKVHSIIEPQIGLFIGYLQYDKTISSRKNEVFVKTTKLYYKILIGHFLNSDAISFFNGKINRSLVIELSDDSMMSFWNLIFHSEPLLDNPISLMPSQIDFVAKDKLIVDLYSGVIVNDKLSERCEIILSEIGKLLEKYSGDKTIDKITIGKENLITKIFNDYLKISYSDKLQPKVEIAKKLYEIIIIAVGHQSFNPVDFIRSEIETFNMMCSMGSIELLSALEKRIEPHYNEELLKILIPNGVTAIWLGRQDNSDKASYKTLLNIAKVLNKMIIKCAFGERVILLDIYQQSVSNEITAYLTCEMNQAYLETIDSLDLQFIDGKFQLNGYRAYGYVKLYNFYSAFLLRKLYLAENITFDQLFPKVKVPGDRNFFGNINSLLFGPPQEEYKFKCETNAVHGINLYLLYLSNRKNQLQTLKEDENLSELFNLFNCLNRRHPIFDSVNDATSSLWENIRMIGSKRTRELLQFFLDKGYLRNDQHNIICIVNRCAKVALISQDLIGFKMWVDYSVKLLANEQNLIGNIIGIKNTAQAVALHDAINIAVALNIPEGLKVILSQYRNFLTIYRSPRLFSKYTTFPFAIVREHSKSKLMEIDSFRESLNEMAVLLLEGGYPIELIEECNDLSVSLFIQSIVVDQVNYSLKRLALNYLDIVPIPFVTQFKSLSQTFLEVKYYLDIYQKSFCFIYSKIEEKTVDISEFCHIFASILQPPDFKSRLKKIGFLTGLRESFTMEDNGPELIAKAREIATIAEHMGLSNEFRLRWLSVTDRPIDFSEICQYIERQSRSQKDNPDNSLVETQYVDFFEHIYRQSQKKDLELALYKMQEKNSMKVLAHIGATFITGTFILLNNPQMRNTVITLIPTIYSGLTLAGSVTSSIFTTITSSILDISYSGLYLLLAGATIYAGCKIYNGINSEKVVQLDLETLENLVKEWQENDYISNHFEAITSKDNLYEVMAKIFKAYTKSELIESDKFFSLIGRFGITWTKLDNAIYCLKHGSDDIAENILIVASAVSYAAIYLNVQKIKKIVDTIEDSSKQKFQTLLHNILAGTIRNIPIAISDIGMRGSFECLKDFNNIGLPIAIDSYNYKKNHYYLCLWHRKDIMTKVLERLDESQYSPDQFSKFILVLEEKINQKSQSREAIIEL